MKNSTVFACAIFCAIPFLFSFKNIPPPIFSNDGITVRLTPVESRKAFKLRLYNLQKKPVRIIIKNLNDQIIYSEKVFNHNGYRKMINLKNIYSGKYIIQIMHPSESRVGILRLNPKSVEVTWNKEELTDMYH
ncbi:MAG: hypothetical protein R2788_26590 [Saprospiraceae bacterium]